MQSKRPTSELRAAASRANGAKSRGPVTERGKYNSSLNSRRHGLLSRFLVLPGEMPELFEEQYNDFMDEHQPRTPTERALVEEMVTSWWRKQRIWCMETARITFQVNLSASMNYAVSTKDPATRTALAVGDLADNGRSLDLFLRYETRYERQFHRALARLLDLKSRDPEPDAAVGPVPTLAPDPPARPPDRTSERTPEPEPVASSTKPVFATGSSEPIESKLPAPQLPTSRSAPLTPLTRGPKPSGFPPSPNAANLFSRKAPGNAA